MVLLSLSIGALIEKYRSVLYVTTVAARCFLSYLERIGGVAFTAKEAVTIWFIGRAIVPFIAHIFLVYVPPTVAYSSRYLLGRLKILCEEAIRKSISVETVCTIFLLAHKHNAEGLKVSMLVLLTYWLTV